MHAGIKMDISPETWQALYKIFGGGVAGAVITALTLFGIAKTKADTAIRAGDQNYELGMTKEQRLLLESLHTQIQAQASRTDTLQNELTSQRDYYEARIDELRAGYRAELQKQEELCHVRLQELQKQVDMLVRQRQTYFQDGCVKLPGTDNDE